MGDYFVTISVDTHALLPFTEYLRDKYEYLSDTPKEGDKNTHISFSNPEASNHWSIKYESYIPDIMTVPNIYFMVKNSPRTGKETIWVTARLNLETYFEYVMNNTLFGLEQGKIYSQRKELLYLLQ